MWWRSRHRNVVESAQSKILDLAYLSGRVPWTGERIIFARKRVARIVLTSGRVIAADGLIPRSDLRPFKQRLPIGQFPVVLTLARIDGEERPAYAMIECSSERAATWEPGLPEGSSPAELKAGERFGFAVDSWHAAFLDADAVPAWCEPRGPDQPSALEIEHNTNAGLWNDHHFSNVAANLVTFFSGFGSGVYACYFGRNAKREVVSLAADFRLLEGLETYRRMTRGKH